MSLLLLGQSALLQRDGHWSALINKDAALLDWKARRPFELLQREVQWHPMEQAWHACLFRVG